MILLSDSIYHDSYTSLKFRAGTIVDTPVSFNSGAVTVAANLGSGSAYDLQAGHANTADLELVALSFGGDAIKVTGGSGNGDLRFDVAITNQSAAATPVLMYKDGTAPANAGDGTAINWSTGPTFSGSNNAVTAQAATGEVVDADVNRYYWIRAVGATEYDSTALSVAANLQADDAYDLAVGHAGTDGLERVALSFGGHAIKVTGGSGNGDLRLNVAITNQSVKATPTLYYKDGSAPTSNTDGTIIPWSTGPTFSGSNNAVTAQAATGEVVDADVNRYYWIRAVGATDVAYDSGEQVASSSINILDTDAVPVPEITEAGVLTTEDISGFGIVFKTEIAFKSLTITFKGNPSVGVAFRIRSSTTKPTASTDAKNYGTQHAQAGGQGVEVTVTASLSNVAANTYFFITLSGGGNRNVSGRKIRFNGTYTNDLSPVAVNITAGTVRVRFDYLKSPPDPIAVNITAGTVRVRFDYVTRQIENLVDLPTPVASVLDGDGETGESITHPNPVLVLDAGAGRTADAVWVHATGYTQLEVTHGDPASSAGVWQVPADGYLYAAFTKATSPHWQLRFTGTGTVYAVALMALVLDFDTAETRPVPSVRIPEFRVEQTTYTGLIHIYDEYSPKAELVCAWQHLSESDVNRLLDTLAPDAAQMVLPRSDLLAEMRRMRWDTVFRFEWAGSTAAMGKAGQVRFQQV